MCSGSFKIQRSLITKLDRAAAKQVRMNRRAAVKAAIGSCLTLLFPWRDDTPENGEEVPLVHPEYIVEISPVKVRFVGAFGNDGRIVQIPV